MFGEAANHERDNLSIIIEGLTPRVPISVSSSSDSALVYLASVWRFFDLPSGHPVLLPKPNGTLFRTYWVPVLSSIELYPASEHSFSVSTTACNSYNDTFFTPLIYIDRRPVAERMPFIDTIKSLARSSLLLQEGTFEDLDPKSWFSVAWSQINIDPQYVNLQRDHLLIFYKFNTPQTRSWLENAKQLVHGHQQGLYIKYNRFYIEDRSPSNKQLRFSFSETNDLVSPLKSLNLSKTQLQHHLDTYDRTYSLLSVRSRMQFAASIDLTWARDNYHPGRPPNSFGFVYPVSSFSDSSSCSSSEHNNLCPHVVSICDKCSDHEFLQQKQCSNKPIDVGFVTMKDALYSHHLCRSPAPSAKVLLDVFNYFIKHLPMRSDLRLENSTITLQGNIPKSFSEEAILSWSLEHCYAFHDSQSIPQDSAKTRNALSTKLKKIMNKTTYSLARYPKSIIHLYVILLLMHQNTNLYKDIPLYYRILINALYYSKMQYILHHSKTSTSHRQISEDLHTALSKPHDTYSLLVKLSTQSSEFATDTQSINAPTTGTSTPLTETSLLSSDQGLNSLDFPKTIADMNYSVDIFPPYDIISFNPVSVSRITFILETLTIADLYCTLCDLMKHFYQTTSAYIRRLLLAPSGSPESFRYLHGAGFGSIMELPERLNERELWRTTGLQLVLSHPIFSRSSLESEMTMQALFNLQLPSSNNLSSCSETSLCLQKASILLSTEGIHVQSANISEPTSVSIPSSALSVLDSKDSMTPALSDIGLPASGSTTFPGSSIGKSPLKEQFSIFSSDCSLDESRETYISILLSADKAELELTSSVIHGEEALSPSINSITIPVDNNIVSEQKKHDSSIIVGNSLAPGDKKRYKKIIVSQYKDLIQALYSKFSHKSSDSLQDKANEYIPYLAFYRSCPSEGCNCNYCQKAFNIYSSDHEKDSSSFTLNRLSSSSKTSIEKSSCEGSARKLLCSSIIHCYIYSEKLASQFLSFTKEYKLTEFADLVSTTIKILSSNSIIDGIQLSFIGCLPLETFNTNLLFYSSADNSNEYIQQLRNHDPKRVVKFFDYPIIYHIFLEIILRYVPVYHDLSQFVLPKLEKFILETKTNTKGICFTDTITIDDSAIQRREELHLSMNSPRKRSSSAEGRNREHYGRSKRTHIKKQQYNRFTPVDRIVISTRGGAQ